MPESKEATRARDEETRAGAKTLTLVLNDPPFESARSTIALRIIDHALRRGHDVNVFAY